MTITLAIENSQHIGGIALRDAHGDVHAEMLQPKKIQRAGAVHRDDDLMPAIDRLFNRLRLTPAALRHGNVAVSIGPGGFTGLRIAVTVAKMLAQTLDVKIAAIPSAWVAAESLGDGGFTLHDQILIALASKGESCWITRMQRSANGWAQVGEAGVRTAATLERQNVHAVLADMHFPEPMRQLCEQSGVAVIDPQFDPQACLRIAEHCIMTRTFVDPLHLSPLYPREPEAVTLWEQNRSKRQGNEAAPPAVQ